MAALHIIYVHQRQAIWLACFRCNAEVNINEVD